MDKDLDYLVEFVHQFSSLSVILAGFCFAATIQLIAMQRRGVLVGVTILAYSSATLAFLYAICVQLFLQIVLKSRMLAKEPESVVRSSILNDVGGKLAIASLLGIVILLVAIALTGWLHSKALGVLITLGAFIFLAFIVAVMGELDSSRKVQKSQSISTSESGVQDEYGA
jgi:hypothetical protein